MDTPVDSPTEFPVELMHAARDLMHQGALLTLDVASGVSSEDLENRAMMLRSLLEQVMLHIAHLPSDRCSSRESYWAAFYKTRESVCFKCAFRRDPDPQAALALSLSRKT